MAAHSSKMNAVAGVVFAIVFHASCALDAKPVLQTMSFELRPPQRLYAAVSGDSAWTIYATGTIDDNAPDRLDDLVKKNKIPPGSSVYLDSPGGSLTAGMKLGRLFRSAGFDTDVGRPPPSGQSLALSGECFSACSLAFLGGRWRYITRGSVYGVHRFYFTKSMPQEADIAQMMAAVVVQFIRDMGADPELFSEMTRAGRDEIVVIPEDDLKRLNVVNDGRSAAIWSVESGNGVVYLKGQQDTAFGTHKFMLACTTDGVTLIVALPPTPHGPLPPTSAVTLVLDDQSYPIESFLQKGSPTLDNGIVFAEFLIPLRLVRLINAAREVGVTFQFDRSAPVYFGFLGMPLQDGASKMSGVLRACTAN